jgi:hypothetical protein
MRCSEARQRLIESLARASADDRELRQHLLTCSDCAAFARAEQALRRDLAMSAKHDSTGGVPLSVLKDRVEARTASAVNRSPQEDSIMRAVLSQFKQRPRLSFTLGVMVVVLIMATLIPFSFEHTSGYEVAIAGVDKDLAMDDQKVNELLVALGMDGADVNVGDCEETCILKISDLKSQGDVQVVVAAFNEMGDCELKEITEIAGVESNTLLGEARKMIFVKEADILRDSDEINQIVIRTLGCLDSAAEGDFNIWVSDDDDTVMFQSGSITHDDDVFIFNPDDLASNLQCDKIQIKRRGGPGGEHGEIIVTDPDGQLHQFNMDDPEVADLLKEHGINLADLPASGSPHCIWISDDSCVTPASGSPHCVWISEDSCAQLFGDYLFDGDSNHVIIKTIGNCAPGGKVGEHECIISMNNTDDGEEIVFLDDDGQVHRISLNDPDAMEQLKALGFEVEVTRGDDGEIQTLRCLKDDGTAKIKMKRFKDDEAEMKETPEVALPDGYELKQNHPNPFNPTTDISFNIPETQHVILEVYNVSGQTVRTLIDAVMTAGEHSVQWDSKNENGENVASGIYVYRLTAGDVVTSKKMTLLK